jgi:NhaP-type Na+/H+ or K+/H+ antiporter
VSNQVERLVGQERMSDGHEILMTVGGLLLLGLLTDALGRRTSVPRVTLLLGFGLLIGPDGLSLLPDVVINSFELVVNMALVMGAVGVNLARPYPRPFRAVG